MKYLEPTDDPTAEGICASIVEAVSRRINYLPGAANIEPDSAKSAAIRLAHEQLVIIMADLGELYP